MKKNLKLALLAFSLTAMFASCKRAQHETDLSSPNAVFAVPTAVRSTHAGGGAAFSLQDFNSPEKKIGVLSGTVFDDVAKERFPNAQVVYFNAYPDMALAALQGKIDAFMSDEPVAKALSNENPNIAIFPEKIEDDEYGFFFSKNEKGKALQKQFNEFLEKIKADGTLDQANENWLGTDEKKKTLDVPSDGPNGILSFATEALYPPFVYFRENEIVGVDVDTASRFCREYGYGLKLTNIAFPGFLIGVSSGRYDIGGGSISITEERKESVLFSEPTYNGGVVLAVRSSSAVPTGTSGAHKSFLSDIRVSFEKTFVRESRWKLIVQGIGTTMLISVLAAVFGTGLGFGICMLRRVKNPAARGAAIVYIRVLQGTPIVVFLMILYYIVFGKSGIPAVAVAVIGFAMNFAAYVSEMIRTGIDAVAVGQTEAALAIGFTKTQTFFKIVMPQAARHFLPVYKGELISLVKSTSVVGYIAIQDLTKMGDIIRSRTYEAFFPLIATAVIYFILAYLLSLVLNFAMKQIEPKRKSIKDYK